ncbi:MAG: FliG C-terminal domain-containing protein [Gemmatimonadota bacterium]
MPAAELPARPNLDNLRKQAKRLHRQLRDGDPAAVARGRRGLPRLSETPDAEVPLARVTLQEVQHVVAVEYGFAHWKELLAQVGGASTPRGRPRRHVMHIRPGLPNVTREAEWLLRLVQEGRGWSVPRIKRGLPRLAHVPESEVPDAGVTLEEARQVVAADYGYAGWAELEADLGQLRPVTTFEDLAGLEDDEIRQVVFRLGRDKLAIALRAVSPRCTDRFRACMSQDEWQALTAAMEELGPMPLSQVEAAQTRILQQYRSDDPLV